MPSLVDNGTPAKIPLPPFSLTCKIRNFSFILPFPLLFPSLPPRPHRKSVTHIPPEPVHDVAFAPNFGRSYHLLAIASRDVKIVSLKPVTPGKDVNVANFSNYSKFEIRQIASFNEHNSQVCSDVSQFEYLLLRGYFSPCPRSSLRVLY